jgi:hypothetical protein
MAQVARAAGTSETNVSAYERGTKRPNDATLSRLLMAIDAGADDVVHSGSLLTAPAAAAAIRRGLRAGWSTADLLRVVREMRTHLLQVTEKSQRTLMVAAPATTGDPRWDAMLAGVVEADALARGYPVPEWTRGRTLPEFWFVGSVPTLRAHAFARSPFSSQIRGVLVDPADLEAV